MTSARLVETCGVKLHAEIDVQASSRPPVVVLHGFTGSTRSMASVAAMLGAERTTLRIDLLGHGESDAPDETAPYTMERCIEQVLGVVDAFGFESTHWLGYSMGGRVALSLAARHPGRVRSLALVGASPGLADPGERRSRVEADEALADGLLHDGLPAFVDRWMALPLFASQARLGERALEEARRQRLRNRPHGLAHSLRGMGSGAMPPLHDALPALARPVQLLVGDEDAKFLGLAHAMEASLPNACIDVIPEAGHAAHLENPKAFAAAVLPRLRAADDEAASSRGTRETVGASAAADGSPIR